MKPLVLGLAYGYKWMSVTVFLKSLRASGFTGDLALFVDARDRSLRRQVERHGGIAIPVGAKYPYNDSLGDGDGDGAFFDGASPTSGATSFTRCICEPPTSATTA